MKQTLSQLRKEKNLSQQKLANMLGLSCGAIAMYETGKRTPSLNIAIRVATIFQVPIEHIQFSNYGLNQGDLNKRGDST